MSEKIRVMIIDDSALMRNLISRMLNSTQDIEVVGTALNGKFGLKKLNKLRPDIIVLDLEMPEMDGIEFLKERNKLGIKTPVIILSAHAKKGAKITLEALAQGASDFVLKPAGSPTEIEETKNILLEMIMALAKPGSYSAIDMKDQMTNMFIPTIPLEKPAEVKVDNLLKPIRTIPEIEIVAIGISTGGPNALRKILPVFPTDFCVPIVIVQHMPPGFTQEFARSLNQICRMEVKEAADNDILKPGRIFIAPGDKHIVFEKKRLATVIKLSDSPVVNGHRPSADVLFRSTAEIYGGNCLACIMTGMGKDGAVNIGEILTNGGITIAQDQNTSIVFGMPRAAVEKGNIHLVKPLDEIPTTIIEIVTNRKIPS